MQPCTDRRSDESSSDERAVERGGHERRRRSDAGAVPTAPAAVATAADRPTATTGDAATRPRGPAAAASDGPTGLLRHRPRQRASSDHGVRARPDRATPATERAGRARPRSRPRRPPPRPRCRRSVRSAQPAHHDAGQRQPRPAAAVVGRLHDQPAPVGGGSSASSARCSAARTASPAASCSRGTRPRPCSTTVRWQVDVDLSADGGTTFNNLASRLLQPRQADVPDRSAGDRDATTSSSRRRPCNTSYFPDRVHDQRQLQGVRGPRRSPGCSTAAPSR